MKKAKCHQNKKHYGNGLCRSCWDRNRRWKSRGINITQQEFEILYYKQNKQCIFCDRVSGKNRQLDVDHNHITGKTRGLLCNEHNRMIGVIEKNRSILGDILKYIDSK